MQRLIQRSVLLGLMACGIAFVTLGVLSDRQLPQEWAATATTGPAGPPNGAWDLARR